MSFERTKKINGHEYRYLVKSVRVDGKVRQQFIKYLGKVPPADPNESKKCPAGKAICPRDHIKCVHWIDEECYYDIDVPKVCPNAKVRAFIALRDGSTEAKTDECLQSKECRYWYAGFCNHNSFKYEKKKKYLATLDIPRGAGTDAQAGKAP